MLPAHWILDSAENKMLVEHWEMGFYNKQDPEMCASYNFNFVLLAACFSALPAFLLAILNMG